MSTIYNPDVKKEELYYYKEGSATPTSESQEMTPRQWRITWAIVWLCAIGLTVLAVAQMAPRFIYIAVWWLVILKVSTSTRMKNWWSRQGKDARVGYGVGSVILILGFLVPMAEGLFSADPQHYSGFGEYFQTDLAFRIALFIPFWGIGGLMVSLFGFVWTKVFNANLSGFLRVVDFLAGVALGIIGFLIMTVPWVAQ